ncbi:hypothetical protein RP20_CCG025248 [Aedes albopictus]|nr:hypothetical protein RP20_CCG025248 [Aedes albopictus]
MDQAAQNKAVEYLQQIITSYCCQRSIARHDSIFSPYMRPSLFFGTSRSAPVTKFSGFVDGREFDPQSLPHTINYNCNYPLFRRIQLKMNLDSGKRFPK